MDGFTIPIGADFSVMQEAVGRIVAAIDQMGNRIVAALEKTSAATMKAGGSMGKLEGGSKTAGAAAEQAGNKADGAGKKLMTVARGAIAMGSAVSGASQALGNVASIMTALSGDNFGNMLTNVTRIGKGLKNAMTSVWGALSKLGESNSLTKIAVGAAAGVAGVLLLRQAFRTVTGSIRLLRTSVSAVFRGIVSAARGAAKAVASAFSGVASLPGKLFSLPGMPIAGLLSVGAALALIVTQLKGASADAAVFEDLQVSASHFLGSVAKGNALLEDMADFGMATPFETIDTQLTAVSLLGAGIRKDVGGITRDLGAMAKNGEQLKELGDAVGKGFAKGKFQTDDLNKFLERGINLIPSLQAAVGLTGKEFIKAVEAGLSFETVTSAIRAMSRAGGEFFGLLEKRSRTFEGLVSTLLSGWTDLRKAIGTPINDALKPILEMGIAKMETLMGTAKKIGEDIGNAISVVFQAFKAGELTELFQAGLSVAFHGAMEVLTRGFRGAVAFLAATLPPIVSGAFAKIQDAKFWQGVGNLFQGFGLGLAAEIKAALPMANMQEVDLMRRKAGIHTELGGMQMSMAGNVDMGKILKEAFLDGAVKAKIAAGGPMGAGLTEALERFEKIVRRHEATAAADKIFGDLLRGKGAMGAATSPSEMSPAETVSKAVTPAVMSLTRIGGGGFTNTVMTGQLGEMRKQTGWLQKIHAAVSKPQSAVTARYA